MFTQKFIRIFHSVQEKEHFHFFRIWRLANFFRIWRSAKPRAMINFILKIRGLDLFNIKLSATSYRNIPNGLRVNFHFFHNLNLGKTSTNSKCHLKISWDISCQYTDVYAKFHHNIPLCSRDRVIVYFFRIWSSAKPRPVKNDISQSLGLDLDNINDDVEVYQNIPLSSRDKVIFTFSEFGARQSLGRW